MAALSTGLLFLMIALLIPGAASGSVVCLAVAACLSVLNSRAATAMSVVFAVAAIGLGSQSAWQTAAAGAVAVVAVIARYSAVLPERLLLTVGAGCGLGVIATLIPFGSPWLALVAPILVVLLIAVVIAPAG